MFKRILVPLDGSSRAEAALPIAVRLARASGGHVLLVQVLSGPGEITPYVAPAFAPSLLALDLDAGAAYLGALRAAILDNTDPQRVQVEFQVQVGFPAARLVSLVREWQADMIVMCSHGQTGPAHRVLGSVAEQVAHRAPVPVLVLREGGPLMLAREQGAAVTLSALVPLDGAADSEAALEPAARIARALAGPGPGRVHLVQVVAPAEEAQRWGEDQPGGEPEERDERPAGRYLRAVAERLQHGVAGELGVEVTWSAVTASDVAEALVAVAEGGGTLAQAGAEEPFALIAMATHGTGQLRGLILGSVADRVLHATRLPLLIVRAEVTAEETNAAQGAHSQRAP